MLLADSGDILVKEFRQLSVSHSNVSPGSNMSSALDDIQFNDLNSICTIGTGTFGRVKLVQHQLSDNVFALKIMRKDDIVSFRQHKNVISEKNLLLACSSCAFIINLISTFNHPNKLYMLMEYVQGGELLTHMYDRQDTVPRSPLGGFDLNVVRFYGANIIIAFDFLASKGIVYRDLKPENLLIDKDGYIKVVDFGFAKVLPYTDSSGKIIDKTYTLCGTPDYLAPGNINRRTTYNARMMRCLFHRGYHIEGVRQSGGLLGTGVFVIRAESCNYTIS